MTRDAPPSPDPAAKPPRTFRSGCLAGALLAIALSALSGLIAVKILGIQHFAIRTGSMSMSFGQPNENGAIQPAPLTSEWLNSESLNPGPLTSPLNSDPLTTTPLNSGPVAGSPDAVEPSKPKRAVQAEETESPDEARGRAAEAAEAAGRKLVLDPPKVGQWSIYRDEEWKDGERIETSWTLWWITKVQGSTAFIETQELDKDGRGLEDIPADEGPFRTTMQVAITELNVDPAAIARQETVKLRFGDRTLECRASTRALESGHVHELTVAPGPIHLSVLRFGRIASTTFDMQGRITRRLRLVDFGETGGEPRPLAPGVKAETPK